jgi:uncharacterized membrane protein
MTAANPGSQLWSAIAATLIAGVVIVALSIPLILEKVGPNRLYGFRTRKTLSSPRIWYAANRVAGRDLLIAGVVVVVSDLILIFFALSAVKLPVPITPTGILLVAVGAALVHSLWAVSKM